MKTRTSRPGPVLLHLNFLFFFFFFFTYLSRTRYVSRRFSAPSLHLTRFWLSSSFRFLERIASFTSSIQHRLGRPLFCFSGGVHCRTLFGILSSSTLHMYPFQTSCFLCTSSTISLSICIIFLIVSFLTLHNRQLLRRKSISVESNLFLFFALTSHTSAPPVSTLCTMLPYIVFFCCCFHFFVPLYWVQWLY